MSALVIVTIAACLLAAGLIADNMRRPAGAHSTRRAPGTARQQIIAAHTPRLWKA